MACKNCGSELENLNQNKDFIKKCNTCSGLLILDNNLVNAIELIDELENKEVINRENTPADEKPSDYKSDDFISEIDCHECNTPMEKFEYMYSSGIHINRCPNCEAVWLEKGKLREIFIYRNGLKEYDKKIQNLLPTFIEVKREVDSTFQKIREDSNPWFKSKND